MVDFTPAPHLYPFASRWFESSVGRVHYIDEGTGPTLLFLHGNPTWSFLYRHIVVALRDRFRCVAVDYPGFGLSARPAGYGYTPREHAAVVSELVDGLDLQDFVLMGQDWGGPIGVAAALDHAARVRGLVMGNTWFWPAESTMMLAFSRVMSTGFMQKKLIDDNFFVERIIPWGMERRLTEEEMDHYRRVQPTPEDRTGAAVFPVEIRGSRSWMAGLEPRVSKELGKKPLLLVWGMRDPGFPAGSSIPRWSEAFDDVTVETLSGAKHYIQEDAPDEIAAAIDLRFGAAARETR